MRTDYVIIGAGISGLTLRHFLKSDRVVLLDPAPFSYKIGESIVPEQFQHPDVLRLLPQIQKLPSYSPKWGTTFISGDSVASFPLANRDAGTAMHIARPEMERVMADAWQIPIVRETVTSVDVQRRIVQTDKNTYEVERQIIDCSGPAMIVAKSLGDVEQLWPVWSTWAYFDIVENDDARFWSSMQAAGKRYLRYDAPNRRVLGVQELTGWSPSRSTILTRLDDGVWSWQIPLAHSSLLSVGIVSRHGTVKNDQFEELALQHRAPNYTLLARRRDGTDWPDRMHGRAGFARRAKVASTEDYILLADAFAFADPIYSVGTALAVNKAIELASVLNEVDWDERISARYNKEYERLIVRAVRAFGFWYSGEVLSDDAAATEVRDNFLAGTAFQIQAARHYGDLLKDASLRDGISRHDVDGGLGEWLETPPQKLTTVVADMLRIQPNRLLEDWSLTAALPCGSGVILRWNRPNKPELSMEVDFDEPAKCFKRCGPLALSLSDLIDGQYPFDQSVGSLFESVQSRMTGHTADWLALRGGAPSAEGHP